MTTDASLPPGWEIPTGEYHAHFDCFSGAAGDMLLASCLDSCETKEQRDQLLAHVTTCLEEGMPELKGEFGIEIKRVWKGVGQIAALHVNVTSIYNHEAAPVPKSRSEANNECTLDHNHGHSHEHGHSHSHNARSEMMESNMTSVFKTVSRYWEKDIEVIDGLLKSGFANGSLISTNFDLKDQEITIEHNPQQLSTDTLQGFFADVGYEVTVVSMGMSASIISGDTNLTHDVTPGVTIQQSQSEDMPDNNSANINVMTSVFKTVSPYKEEDMRHIESTIKLSGGPAIRAVTFNLPTREITVEHDPAQHSTKEIGEFIARAGFGVLIISMGMSASVELPLPDNDTPRASPTNTPTLTHDFTPNDGVKTQQSQDDGHNHGHSHGHGSSKLRNLPEIRNMLESAPDAHIHPWVKTNAIAAFTELAKAEAHTHGASVIDAVHFHEVGAVDSIVDTVGTLIALNALGVTSVSISRLPIGEGMVWTDHGLLPVPAPATLRLMIGMPTCRGPPGVTGELVTPTGAALLRALTLDQAATLQGRPPDDFVLKQVGIGAGTKNFDKHPNILRLMLGTVGFQ